MAEASDLPARPPVLWRPLSSPGMFYALAQEDVIVTGDIGCYSLGVMPPLAGWILSSAWVEELLWRMEWIKQANLKK